mgnify:CR=1 FL=1
MDNLYDPMREAALRLRPILAPNDDVEEFFFQQISRATVLIDVAERRIASGDLNYERYQKVLKELNSHRRWLMSALQTLTRLQSERAQSNPAQPPSRLARVHALTAKRTQTAPLPATAISAPAESTPEDPAPAEPASSAQPETPRNAPCPCGSGEKFKRCCGKSAPPVLNHKAA